jgi:RNA polymerase sigma-70 factor (ECF subfamily)
MHVDELLSAVVARLIKALEKIHPRDVRAFFSLVNQHIRWELNDLARRLDETAREMELVEEFVLAPESSGCGISVDARRMLDAIEDLPAEEREVFSLLRIQGLTQTEVADLVGVSIRTVQRRLNRSVLLLFASVADLRPNDSP